MRRALCSRIAGCRQPRTDESPHARTLLSGVCAGGFRRCVHHTHCTHFSFCVWHASKRVYTFASSAASTPFSDSQRRML